MQRSYMSSQFIAWIFAMVGSMLLVPGVSAGLFGMLILTALTIDGLGTTDVPVMERITFDQLTTILSVPAILTIGSLLLWGYWRHVRGRNGLRGSLVLWLGTALYNGTPLVWSLRMGLAPFLSEPPAAIVLNLLILLYWLAAVVLALVAAALDLRAQRAAVPDKQR